jgi:ZIP family zinc transporter
VVKLSEALWIIAAGSGTTLGAIALVFVRRPSDRMLDVLLGFAGGVMLAATAFSLLVPALDRGSLVTVLVGFGLGAAVLRAMDALIPHVHARFSERGHEDASQHRALMLISALTIHNVPEGMAVGVAFAAGGADLGVPIALAIGIQNIPEGFVAGAPLLGMTGRATAIGIAALTGFVEPPAAFAAFAGLDLLAALLAGALAFAAGAMLYVVVDEIIPESHGRGNERDATIAFLLGFALMLALDNGFS